MQFVKDKEQFVEVNILAGQIITEYGNRDS